MAALQESVASLTRSLASSEREVSDAMKLLLLLPTTTTTTTTKPEGGDGHSLDHDDTSSTTLPESLHEVLTSVLASYELKLKDAERKGEMAEAEAAQGQNLVKEFKEKAEGAVRGEVRAEAELEKVSTEVI